MKGFQEKRTILLATDNAFWRRNFGTSVRIHAIYHHLRSQGFRVAVLILIRLNAEYQGILERDYPDLELYPLRENELGANAALLAVENRIGRSLWQRILNRVLPEKLAFTAARIELSVRNGLQKAGLCAVRTTRTGMKPRLSILNERRLQNYPSPANQQRFLEVCDEINPGFILVVFARLIYLLDALDDRPGKRPLTLVDTIDILHLRTRRFHQQQNTHWVNITESEEKDALSRADVIIGINAVDTEMFQKMMPDRRIITVTHPVQRVRHDPPGQPVVNLLFIGANSDPNIQAIRWFIRNAWPGLQEKHGGGIRLSIVGDVCSTLHSTQLPEGIDLLGFVDDLNDAYARADVVINPVRFGAGLKIKCVEALCHGKPLVTTPIGAEGIENGAGRHFIVVENPSDFMTQVDRLIIDPDLRAKFSKQAHLYAKDNFSESAVFRPLLEILNGCGNSDSCLPAGQERGE